MPSRNVLKVPLGMEAKGTPARKKSFLEERRNFMTVASLSFSVLSGLGLLWLFGNYGGFGWWLFIAAVAFVIGRVWAFFMWFVFKSVYAIDESNDK